MQWVHVTCDMYPSVPTTPWPPTLSKKSQMSKSWTIEEGHKSKLTQWDSHNINFNFDVTYEGHYNCQKYFLWTFWGFLTTFICDAKIYINMCEPHCVNLFFMNLVHSSSVWFFDIWHLFHELTSFWHFDFLLKSFQPISAHHGWYTN